MLNSFYILYAFVWVITCRLEFICRCFRTLCLFHLPRQVDLPAYEDGRDSVPKGRHINFRHRVITQKKAYNIQNMAKAWNQEYITSMGRKLQDTFDYSKNSASRKSNSSPPLLSFFTAEITTPYLISYSSITTSTPALPIESINAPVLLYSGKGYITTHENFTIHRGNCWKYTYI
jgi:hypothetical protein